MSTSPTHHTSPTELRKRTWRSLSEQQRRVLQALVQLPFKQRSVMAWHLDGFSTGEIAEAMGLEKAAVLQNLSRARRTLEQQLGITDRRRTQ